MSEDKENKPDDFDFDPNGKNQEMDAGNPFADDDFNPFADDDFTFGSVTPAEAQTTDSASDSALDSTRDSTPDPGEFLFPAAEEAAPEPPPGDEGAPETSPLGDLPMPSGFLMGGDSEETTESSEATEDGGSEESELPLSVGIDTTNKKGKKKKKDGKEKKVKEKKVKEKKTKPEKAKKGKTSKHPLGVGGLVSILFAILLLIALIGANVYIVLNPPSGIGFNSTVYYLVGMDVFGLCALLVPLLFFFNREKPTASDDTATPQKPEDRLDIFKVALGVSVMAMCVGTILLLTALYRYDFDIKATSTMPTAPRTASSSPAPEMPAETPPASEEAPAETESTTEEAAPTEEPAT